MIWACISHIPHPLIPSPPPLCYCGSISCAKTFPTTDLCDAATTDSTSSHHHIITAPPPSHRSHHSFLILLLHPLLLPGPQIRSGSLVIYSQSIHNYNSEVFWSSYLGNCMTSLISIFPTALSASMEQNTSS